MPSLNSLTSSAVKNSSPSDKMPMTLASSLLKLNSKGGHHRQTLLGTRNGTNEKIIDQEMCEPGDNKTDEAVKMTYDLDLEGHPLGISKHLA